MGRFSSKRSKRGVISKIAGFNSKNQPKKNIFGDNLPTYQNLFQPKILAVDDDIDLLQILQNGLLSAGFQVKITTDPVEGWNITKSWQPDVILLDYMMPNVDGLQLCKHVRTQKCTQNIPIIFISAYTTPEQKIASFEYGADDFIGKPFELPEVIARINVQIRHLNKRPKSSTKKTGRIISVFSLRGGVGKTSMAINLAVAFSEKISDKRVALLDMSFVSGQVGLMLNIKRKYNWSGLVDAAKDPLPTLAFQKYFIPSGCQSVDVLLAPNFPSEAEKIDSDLTNKVFNYVRKNYPLTIIDTHSTFDDTTISGLDASDLIILMLTPDVSGVVLAGKALDVFNSLGYAREKIILAGNLLNESTVLTPDMLKQTLGGDLNTVFPYDKKGFAISSDVGKPLVEIRAASQTAKQYKGFANYLNKHLSKMP
jgi:pilus assembly protein CpaE